VVSAARVTGGDTVEELVHEEPLAVPDGAEFDLRIFIAAADADGRSAVTVHARRADTEESAWTRCAHGTIARLGLEPGTEQFYLVPQSPRKGAPKEILGITGYQGLVELMYRAGAVASVIVEAVREHDVFNYVPGRDERPIHEIDWDADDRGKLKLVYAYAIMKGGATSKVVVLNRSRINEIKAKSASARSDYSPWATSEEAMWLKSAARQLAKWVPTSAEYIREQLRAVRDVQAERPQVAPAQQVPAPAAGTLTTESGEVLQAEIVEDNFDDNAWLAGEQA